MNEFLMGRGLQVENYCFVTLSEIFFIFTYSIIIFYLPLERVSLYRHCNTVSLVFHFISFLFTILINLRFESTWSFWKQINSRYNEPFFYAISKFSKFSLFDFFLENILLLTVQLFDHSFSKYLILLLLAAIFSRDLLQTRLISTEGSNGL